MEFEIWKDIQDCDGIYQISSFGRIKKFDRFVLARYGSYRTIKGMIWKPKPSGRGYVKVTLLKNNKQKTFLLHQLIAKAFIDNPNKYEIINHIDFNPSNNVIGNLEWCTQSHNIMQSHLAGRLKFKPAKRITTDTGKLTMATLIPCLSRKEITEHYGVNIKYISDICTGHNSKEFNDIFNSAVKLKENNFAEYR
jgi:hypothetical protein